MRASEMTHLVKVLASRPEVPSSIPGVHMLEEPLLLQVVF